MQHLVPPLRRQYEGRLVDYVLAMFVWLCLFLSFVTFVGLRTGELVIASQQVEQIETHLERRAFPELKLDICELRERGSGGFSALPYITVQMQELWHEFEDVMNTRVQAGRHEDFAPPVALHKTEFTMSLPEFEFSDTDKQDKTYKDAVLECGRFAPQGQYGAPNDVVFYSSRYQIRINLTASAAEESKHLLEAINGVSVITGLFLRFSLAHDPLSRRASLDEYLALRRLPCTFPGQATPPKGAGPGPGMRQIKVSGQPNFHKWIDTLGGRRGANESDTATFKVKDILETGVDGVTAFKPGENVDPRTIVEVNIDDATSVVSVHINNLYTNLMNYFSSILAATSVFGIMSWLFVPVNNSLRFPQRHFRFLCCGFGGQGQESDELDEDTPLLKTLEQGKEQGHDEGRVQLPGQTDKL